MEYLEKLARSPNTLSKRIKKNLFKNKVRKIHSSHRKEHLKEYEEYDAILAKYRDLGGLKNEFQPYKLFSLNELPTV